MKRITASLFAVLVTVALVSLFVPSSFAAKALSDDEMDATTAKGQSAIEKGSGNQDINDKSSYNLTLDHHAQETLTAGDAVNAVGENNVASAVNAVSTTGTGNSEQHIDLTQSKAASITKIDTCSTFNNSSSSDFTTKSTSHSFDKIWNDTETIAPANISIVPVITTTGTGNGNATATGSATANANVQNTGSYSGDAQTDGHARADAQSAPQVMGTDGLESRHSQRFEIQANIQHKQDNYTTDYQTYEVAVVGNDAAISKATANSDVQANGVGIGKTLTEVDIKLPIAHNSSGECHQLDTCDVQYNTVCTRESGSTQSHSSSIVADHIEEGNGDQTIKDNSTWDVSLKNYAQADATILNAANLAGRNNVVTAWNIAAQVNGNISGSAGAGTVTQTIVVSQVN